MYMHAHTRAHTHTPYELMKAEIRAMWPQGSEKLSWDSALESVSLREQTVRETQQACARTSIKACLRDVPIKEKIDSLTPVLALKRDQAAQTCGHTWLAVNASPQNHSNHGLVHHTATATSPHQGPPSAHSVECPVSSARMSGLRVTIPPGLQSLD